MLTSMLWGAGTAIGEIPPYWITFSAAKAGKAVEENLSLTGQNLASGNAGEVRLGVVSFRGLFTGVDTAREEV